MKIATIKDISKSIAVKGTIVTMLLLSLAACVNTVSDGSQDDRHASNTNFSASADFSYDLSVNNQNLLTLDGINGSVLVVGTTDSNRVLISGRRVARSESTEDAEAWLKKITVLVNTLSNSIEVQTDQPDETFGRNLEVYYDVRVPQGWQVTIDHVNGDVTLDTLSADARLSSVNGNIWVKELHGGLNANLVNGQINSTVFLPENKTCDLETVNGIITLSIPRTTSAMLSASVVNGSIDLTNLDLTQSSSSSRSLSGKLGGGNGTIRASSVNGSIHFIGF